MPNCSAWRCKNQSEKRCIDPKTNKRVTFHRFPHRDPKRLKVWLFNLRRENFTPSRTAVLCSVHFEESCMDRTGQTVRLREHAAPTIFPDFPAHLQKILPRPRRVIQRVFPTISSDSEEDSQQLTASGTRLQTTDSFQPVTTSPTATGLVSSDTGTAYPGTSKTTPLYFSGPVKLKKTNVSETIPTGYGATSTVSSGTALPGTSKTTPLYFSGPVKVKKTAGDSAGEHSYSITESRKELKRKLDKSVKITMQLRTQLKTSHQRARRLKVKLAALKLVVDSLQKREAEILRLFKMDSVKCRD